jgi:hypothetical protein
MSVSLTVVNKQTGEILNESGPYLLVDDTPRVLKQKLFLLTKFDILNYPKLLQIEIVDKDGQYKTVVGNNPLLFEWTVMPETPTVYVTNLINVIETLVSDVSELYINQDKEVFDTVYQSLKQQFADLTREDLMFTLIAKLVDKDRTKLTQFGADIRKYQTLAYEKTKDTRFQPAETALKDFYKLAHSVKDFSQYFNTPFQFDSVAFTLRGNSFKSGVNGRFIKLFQMFNVIQLNDQIPFVALGTLSSLQDQDQREPMIKVYNKLLADVPEKEIKSWVLNERKNTQLTRYKKIKGLMLKIKVQQGTYMTLNIMENGMMTVKLKLANEETDDSSTPELDQVTDIMKEYAEAAIRVLNKLPGVFTKARRINLPSECQIYIDAISGHLTTDYYIDRAQFNQLLYKRHVSENYFELKQTISDEVLSLYYKKIGTREILEGEESDKKGITVNIRDNPFQTPSSIIHIYGAYNMNQIPVIAKEILLLSKVYMYPELQTPQIMKDKSHIKWIRNQGVKIQSKECQKQRQPNVDSDDKPISKSYTLEYKSKKFVCPSQEFPYPGFTVTNIVCCFMKDQRYTPKYLNNMPPSDIYVQPSNFKVSMTDDNNNVYETYVVKVVSEYKNGFDETNSMPRFYVLSSENELVTITNDELIRQISEVETEDDKIWLKSVPLVQITGATNNNSRNPPDMSKKTQSDLHAPCSHHKKNTFFGYNVNSEPYCFNKPPHMYTKGKGKKADITKQHILISDKILDFQRIGTLPAGLNKLFNELIGNDEGVFHRMGVKQNQSAFLNAVLLACGNNVGGETIDTTSQFKHFLVKYLKVKPPIFDTLNSGNISLKYFNIENYATNILNTTSELHWGDIVDLVQRATETNVIVLDIPYNTSDSTIVADYENIKLICNPSIKMNLSVPFVILLKRMKTFEVIISMPNTKEQKSVEIGYTFNYQNDETPSTNIVNFLIDYAGNSCKRESVFPKDFPFDDMLSPNKLRKLLAETEHKIIAQIVNKFKKVDGVVTSGGFIIPVKERGVSEKNGDSVTMEDLTQTGKLKTLKEYLNGIQAINEFLPNMNVKGVTLDDDKDTVTAVLTNFGKLIPVASSSYSRDGSNIEILDYKYYPDVDNVLYDSPSRHNPENEYNHEIRNAKQKIYKTKRYLAEIINNREDVKTQVMDLNTDTKMSRQNKIVKIIDIFRNLLIASEFAAASDMILQHIAVEVINDNVENLLINDMVISDGSMDEILRGENESILLNVDDLQRWTKRHGG